MPVSEIEVARLQRDIENLRHTVYGNGKEGLDEMIRKNTAAITAIQTAGARTNGKLDDLKASIDALRQERRDNDKKREGRADTLKLMDYLLRLLAAIALVGGPLGLWRVSTQWETVQQQLRNLPSLPE